MAAPLATEKVLRTIILALQRGNLIASGSDVALIESVPNNATSADISAILDQITFGSGSSTGSIVSNEDVDIFIDADDNDSALINTRYFRVSQDQSAAPVVDQNNELMTLANLTWLIGAAYPTLTIGARTALCTSSQGALLNIGSSTAAPYGQLVGGPGDVLDSRDGLSIRSNKYMDFRCDKSILVGDVNGNYVRGGWEDPVSYTRLHVGDFTTPDSLTFEAEDIGAGIHDFTIRSSATDTVIRNIFMRGSNVAADYRTSVLIGGKSGEAWSDPSALGGPTLAVIGDDNSTTASALYVYDRKTARTAWSSSMMIKAMTAPASNFYYLRVVDNTNTGVFSINSSAEGWAVNGFHTGLADVAEAIVTEQAYEPGTVLAIQGGAFVKTSTVGQTNVAGVVSTAPGFVLGSSEDPEEKAKRIKLAICGFVPVMCSTERGDILGDGETLVSGPDGTAVVDHDPRPGTIIGKAKGRLVQDSDTAVKGLVDVLVNLQ